MITQDDIIVTAKRLERLKRLNLAIEHDRNTGTSRCIFKRRSGDPTLDAIICDATLTCAPKVQTSAEARACVAPRMNALVTDDVPWQAEADAKRR